MPKILSFVFHTGGAPKFFDRRKAFEMKSAVHIVFVGTLTREAKLCLNHQTFL